MAKTIDRVQIDFTSQGARDAFIDKYFPTRKHQVNGPGVYKIPGGWLCVSVNHIQIDVSRVLSAKALSFLKEDAIAL